MKKVFLFCVLALLSVNAMADGDSTTLNASKIAKITFEGDKVNIQYNDGTADAQFNMEEVVINFTGVTSIEDRIAITRQQGLEGKAVYNLKGQLVGNSAARLTKGIYVINGKKVVIK